MSPNRDRDGALAAAPWTVERANRALPLVRRIADDLVRTHATWQALVEQFELAAVRSTATKPDPEAERLAREVQRAAKEIQGFVGELTSLGVECKSIESGLMDFPGERDGRLVYFCWKHGESAVTHWHELDAGFAGRQPL
jgi:hypothetical protein